MENICGILYEKFRPFIIQMNHMETLAELCNILKVEMLEDHIQKRGNVVIIYYITVKWVSFSGAFKGPKCSLLIRSSTYPYFYLSVVLVIRSSTYS